MQMAPFGGLRVIVKACTGRPRRLRQMRVCVIVCSIRFTGKDVQFITNDWKAVPDQRLVAGFDLRDCLDSGHLRANRCGCTQEIGFRERGGEANTVGGKTFRSDHARR